MRITCISDLAGLPKPYDLRGANLEGADLSGANLRGANLERADLVGACLSGANLEWADLSGANLEGADLSGANLAEAYFWLANLKFADLRGAKLPELFVKLPPVGESFIAWKKVYEQFILKLEIPAGSPRVSTFIGRKCRAKSAKVLEAFVDYGNPTPKTKFESLHERTFIYRLGEVVEVSDFDDDIRVECTRGVHFFLTREEAEEYVY